MKKQKNKSKVAEDIREKLMSKESFVRQATSWLRDNNVLSNYEINGMILAVYMASKRILNVEMFIDKKDPHVKVIAYVGRFSYLFRGKKQMIKTIVENLMPFISGKFTLNVEIQLHKKYE